MVINHLLTGMILQVGYGAMIKEKTNGSGVAIDPFQVFFFNVARVVMGVAAFDSFQFFF